MVKLNDVSFALTPFNSYYAIEITLQIIGVGLRFFSPFFFLFFSTLVRYYYFNCFFGNYQIDNYVIVLVVPFYPNYICTDRQENFLGGWSLHFFLCIAYLLFVSFSFFSSLSLPIHKHRPHVKNKYITVENDAGGAKS